MTFLRDLTHTNTRTDEMMAELEPVMKRKLPKAIRTRDNLYDFFISRARANLHIALCFSPVTTTIHKVNAKKLLNQLLCVCFLDRRKV